MCALLCYGVTIPFNCGIGTTLITNVQIILMVADTKSHMALQLVYIPDLWFQTMHGGNKSAAKTC